MIVLDEATLPTGLTPGAVEAPTPPPTAGLGDVLGAAGRLSNDVVNAVGWVTDAEQSGAPDKGYSLLEDKAFAGTKYEQYYGDEFVGVRSEREARKIMRELDSEEKDREIVDSAGFLGWLANAGAAILSPTLLIPGGIGARAAMRTGFGVGGRLATRVAGGAVLTGGAVAAQEGILQGFQRTRTAEESMFNVASGALIGGVLGAAAGGLSEAAMAKMVRRVAESPATRADEVAAFQSATNGDFSGSARRVYDDVSTQLRAAGVADAEVAANAAVVAARYSTRAQRLGLGEDGALDLYKGEGISVSRLPGVPGAEVSEDTLLQAVRAYHGSPHDFDKFSTDKIGTGEGVQAYGHGLYFAENEGVAKSYRDMLSRSRSSIIVSPDGDNMRLYEHAALVEAIPETLPRGVYDDLLGRYGEDDLSDAFHGAADAAQSGEADLYISGEGGMSDVLRAMRESGWKLEAAPQSGRMYQVEISAETEKFLDWDRPLSGQSPAVQDALSKIGYFSGGKKAGEAYERLGRDYGGPDMASGKLSEVGIPGIKYLDQGSRGAEGGTYNYVIFDDRLINIVRKYSQDARGQITLADGKAAIDLFTKADASTFMHEASHLWLTEMVADAGRAAGAKADLAAVMKWLGVDDASKIGRAEQEKWATAFERYLAEGKAPSSRLKKAFDDFRTWLSQIYRSLNDLGQPIPDDVRGVMDRLLATDEELYRSVGDGSAGSLGAAAAASGRGAGTVKGALGAENVVGFQDPLLRLQRNPLASARNTIRDLAETPLTLAENADGIATSVGGSVETRIKMAMAPVAEALEDLDRSFASYYLGKEDARFAALRSEVDRFTGRSEGRMTYSQFKEAVWQAALDGDVHPIPSVQRAAVTFRKKVFDPAKDQAIEAGILPKDVRPEMDAGYVPRIYNAQLIAARRPEFVNILASWLQAGTEAAGRAAAAIGQKLELKQAEVEFATQRAEETLAQFRRRQAALEQEGKGASGDAAKASAAMRARSADFAKEERAAERARTALYRDLLADLKRGRPKDKAGTIVDLIRGRGGIRLERSDAIGRAKYRTDRGAEIARTVKGAKGGRGVVSPTGMDPDLMLRLAVDEGYLSVGATLDDLVSAVDDTLKGRPVYSMFDEEAVSGAQRIDSLLRDLEGAGLDVGSMTPDDLAKAMGDTTRPLTPAMAKFSKEIEEIAARFDSATLKVGDIERLADELRQMAPDMVDAARASKAAGRAAAKDARALERELAGAQSRADMAPDELVSIADEVVDVILGHSSSRVIVPADLVAGPRGPLKERTLRIPTELIKEFVEKDIEVLARRYAQTMAADTNLVKTFGSTDLVDQINKINDEANALISKAELPKERQAIEAQRKAAIRDISGVRDRLRGAYALPDNPDGLLVRTGRVVRNLNYMRLLGGMTLSAVPDIARTVMVHGLTRSMGTAFIPFTKGMSSLKLAAKEVKLAGTALDMVLDSRAMSIADIMDDYGRGRSKFERGVQAASTKFGLVSLMAPWNAAMKQFAGIVTQTRILQAVDALADGKLGAKEIEYLAADSIDNVMADRIAAQFRTHGEKDGGLWWANTEKWTDRQAVQSLRAALVRDVDRIIVTPGQDKPLWMSTEWGKVIGQFRTFNVASMQRTVLSGLQQRDMAALNGAMLMLSLGALKYYLTSLAAGREPSTDPTKWATEALDSSGLLGWIADVNNTSEKVTRGRVGMSFFTGEMASRYASRGVAGSLLGPSFDLVTDLAQIGGSAASQIMPDPNKPNEQGWSASDTRAVRKMLPMQNIFYLRRLFDSVEENVNSGLGVPEKKN